MKLAYGFVFGFLLGTVVSLLFAPTSGEELRTTIKSQMDTQSAKMQEQWQQRYQQLQGRLNRIDSDLQAIEEQSANV
jgi:gas vesicle protein